MTKSSPINARVRAWRREYVRALALEASGLLAAWGLAAAGAAVWLDALLVLPKNFRLGVLAFGAASAAAALWRFLFKPLLDLKWSFVLAAAEARFPALKSSLATAFEFLSGPARDTFTSAQMRTAHIEQTERLLEGVPPGPLFPWTPGRLVRKGGAAALLAGISLPWVPGGPSWDRFLAPWTEAPLESFVTVTPGDAEVAWGEPALIEAVLARETPPALGGAGELTLRIRAGGSWKDAPWDSASGRAAAFRVGAVTERLEYRLAWRGLSSRVYALEPAPRPQWSELSARVHTPHGAKLTARLDSGEALSVPRGSWVILSGRPNVPLASGRLRASWQAPPIELKTVSENALEAGFQALEDGSFHFELVSRSGLSDPKPVVYAVRAQADRPPAVDLISPSAPAQAGPDEPFLVSFAARDDFGLSRLALQAKVLGRAGKEFSIELEGFGDSKDFTGDHPLDLSAFPAGTVIELQVRAWDNARPPQSAVSVRQTVEVVDFEAAHKGVREKWLKAQGTVQNLLARERELAELSARQEGLGASTGPVLSLINERLAGLSSDWKEAAASVEDLARAMAADAFSNPGLSEETAASAESLQGARERELPRALESSRRGAWSEARRRHEALARRLEAALGSLQEGLQVQELQDMNSEAARMKGAGSELEAALESLAESRGRSPTAAEKERLKAALERLGRGMEALQRALASLPKALPEEAEAGRRTVQVPLNAARDTADALARAMAAGDFAEAARLAGELSEQLEMIQRAVSQGARSAPGASGEGSRRLESLQETWSKAVEEQSRSLEEAQGLEQSRMAATLAGQKALLEELKARQGVLISSASAWTGLSPFPPSALEAMKGSQTEFLQAKIRNAPALLRAAAEQLRNSAAQAPPADAAGLGWFAARESELRALLESPIPAGPPSAEGLRSALQRQAEAGEQARRLESELEEAERELGVLPGEAVDEVKAARREQGSAEAALGRGDSAAAVGHEGEALSLLDKGRKRLGQALSRQQGIESSKSRTLSMPSSGGRGGRGGRTGSDLGSVPLPGKDDYRPPRRLREELRKSLLERRPAGLDPVVKEYFKRLSQ